MMLSRIDVAAPESLAEASALLAADPDGSVVLAGGQSLLILVRQGLVAPATLVDLHGVGVLHGVSALDGALRIGSMTTYGSLVRDDVVRSRVPVLARAAGSVGSVHIRNRGTIGGSVAHCDPAGDVPTVLLALGAVLTVAGDGALQEIEIDGFFRGLFETALAPGQLLTSLSVPVPPPTATTGYTRFCFRAGEYPLCVVACRLDWADGVCTAARVAVGGGFDHPRRVAEVELLLTGRRRRAGGVEELLTGTRSLFAPIADVRGSAQWKARVVERTLIAAVTQAIAEGEAA
jgi:carbon-monoxide dehydrogenase medium subunit